MKKKNEHGYKAVRRKIREKKKAINSQKDKTEIEKLYMCQDAIKEYYEKNESKISDDDLIEIYNREYNPGVLSELAMGLFSGLLASAAEKLISFNFPYSEGLGISKTAYFVISFIILIVLVIAFFFGIIFVYKEVSGISSYDNKINEYHKELLDQYIKKRESKYEKKDKNEPKRNKKNRKHK